MKPMDNIHAICPKTECGESDSRRLTNVFRPGREFVSSFVLLFIKL
jgi:hypothetical protein